MHFRGCSGRLNRAPRTYHSGETEDARAFLTYLRQTYPNNEIAAVGVSLGGNMLVRYLANYHHDPIVSCGCAISPPLDLAACSTRIQQGFSRVYQAYLLRSMRQTLSEKLTRHQQVGRWHAASGQRLKPCSSLIKLSPRHCTALTMPNTTIKPVVVYPSLTLSRSRLRLSMPKTTPL